MTVPALAPVTAVSMRDIPMTDRLHTIRTLDRGAADPHPAYVAQQWFLNDQPTTAILSATASFGRSEGTIVTLTCLADKVTMWTNADGQTEIAVDGVPLLLPMPWLIETPDRGTIRVQAFARIVQCVEVAE